MVSMLVCLRVSVSYEVGERMRDLLGGMVRRVLTICSEDGEVDNDARWAHMSSW